MILLLILQYVMNFKASDERVSSGECLLTSATPLFCFLFPV